MIDTLFIMNIFGQRLIRTGQLPAYPPSGLRIQGIGTVSGSSYNYALTAQNVFIKAPRRAGEKFIDRLISEGWEFAPTEVEAWTEEGIK